MLCQTTKRSSRDQRGFTFIELMMGLAIFSVVLMATMFALNFFWSKSNALQSQISTHLDLSVLEKYLYKDLNAAFASFGTLNKYIPNTTTNFFDIYLQTPLAVIPTTLQTRTFVLDASQGGGYIEFIVSLGRSQDIAQNGLQNYYSPSEAYTGPPLSFVGLDQKSFFTNHYPNLYSGGNHFFFFEPAAFTPTSCHLNYCTSAYYGILGFPSGGQFVNDNMDGQIANQHPLYNQVVADIDTWFRWLPAIGGAQALVAVLPVNVVKYHLVPDGLGSGNLFRTIKIGNTYQTETLIAKDINRITFLRPDVTNALIQFGVDLKR